MDVRRLTLVIALIALNLVGARVANTLGLPFFLDTIATILAPVLLGLPLALVVAVGTSALSSLINFPGDIWYAGTQVVIALLAYGFARLGWFRSWWRALLAGAIIGAISAVVSAPVTMVLFKGVTVPGVTAVTGLFVASGQDLWSSVLSGALVTSSIDKIGSAFIAYMIISRLPERFVLVGGRTD